SSRNACHISKISDTLCRISSSANTTDGWHARVVPSIYNFFIYQLQQFSFAHYCVADVSSCKFKLTTWKNSQFLNKPVVQRFMYFKFECTNAVRNIFDRVTLSVSKIVHRINTPLVACTMMMCMFDAIHQRVAQVHVG